MVLPQDPSTHLQIVEPRSLRVAGEEGRLPGGRKVAKEELGAPSGARAGGRRAGLGAGGIVDGRQLSALALSFHSLSPFLHARSWQATEM